MSGTVVRRGRSVDDNFDVVHFQNGAIEIVTRPFPDDPVDETLLKRIGGDLNLRKYRKRARFKNAIPSDLSGLRISTPSPKSQTMRDRPFIEDFDRFMKEIDTLVAEFRGWAAEFGEELQSSDDAIEFVWKHADEIDADRERLFRAAIATYGELLRREIGGVWTTAPLWARKGEPAVKRRKHSILCRPVVEEVVKVLDLEPYSQSLAEESSPMKRK